MGPYQARVWYDTLMLVGYACFFLSIIAITAEEIVNIARKMTAEKPPILCDRTGKMSYPTRRQARAAIRRLKGGKHAPDKDITKLNDYRCRFCGGFHIGHRSTR